jgi:hypothetical protein
MDYIMIVLNYAYISDANRKKMGYLTTENLLNLTYSGKETKNYPMTPSGQKIKIFSRVDGIEALNNFSLKQDQM